MPISRAKTAFYAGWALGLAGVLLASADELVAGLLIIPAGLLLLLAATWGIASEMPIRGNPPGGRRFVGAVLGAIGLCWIALGVGMVVAPSS